VICSSTGFGVGAAVSAAVDYRYQSAALYIPAGARPGEGTTYIPAIINPQVRIVGLKVSPGVSGKGEGY
jgi:hypothetical protein